jgi:hypothetical protein
MGMLERYKKRGGFLQLLNLLETTDAVKKERFMKMILEEDANWDAALRQKMLSFDKLLAWDVTILMEFMPQVPVMAIAYAVAELTPENKTKILKSLPFGDQKKIEEILVDAKPKPNEIISSQLKILTELRTQVAAGKLKMERISPDLAIPEDIEEQLASGAPVAKRTVSAEIDTPKETAKPAATAAATSAPSAASTVTPISSPNGNSASVQVLQDELSSLKKKMMTLSQENVRLMKEVEDYKARFNTIKIAVQKAG